MGPKSSLSVSPAEVMSVWLSEKPHMVVWMRMAPMDLHTYLTTWSPVGGIIPEGFKGVVLLEKMYHRWVGFEGSKACGISS